ncbi:TPA: type VI secretion system baseplate subunit TssF [Klebsiella michiganensis]|uniref:type VI secretion system baseplate subunit TssF n=1 Tax=Klebsiella michiganensis TaxID=1134687 RepID=UPI00046AF09F|nr:type VI secretion system baseplate subunit TssF [Klebsiella michiganensis]EKQ6540263.1 type VI secretion system baseplate subunit TssF [Klebsiella michiganensis]ELQ7987376.1 type VI secretion system baseplate subunit TssF [Klebsiella michiganensis]MBG2580233.1 type VI secretion system baseplate subunit TssF [Klebsiella michiganensis]MBG2594418.1 type VI secretion system baseplate subunit TssF [Klebsiella michiganensis]MBQ4656694.1 type VI secretion system baseplate subunit TssF [Klebsiella 
MDDLTLRYYEAEMRYLREAGKEFARAHPDRAAMLNLDKPGARDPYVERLFEGFAFLMGRLREKLDDDLPELTEGLVSLLWPHYMRTIPSLAIVEFTPDWRSLRQAETLAEGFSVLSRPIGPQKTTCQYRTTRDVPLQPLQLADARLHTETDGRSAIRLRFECPEKVDWSKSGLEKVALFLNAESPVSSALHLAMTRRVHAMYARHVGTGTERHKFDGWCKPMGFDDNDGLWKKADTAFSGYQLLLEYFSFRPKFMFVELRGLDTIGLTEASSWFEIDIVLSEAWSSDLPFETENFRLHCAPVINLFTLEADPLTLNPLDNEYLLRPLRLQDGHTEIYSVDNIHGAVKNGKHPYVPFTSFRHRGGMMRHDAPERYYHTRVKRGPSGLYDTWLILGGRSFELEQLSDKLESLSMRITGTNGQLPRKALESTLLDRVVKTGKVPVRVLNVTAPTMPLYPPANDRFHWRVMSHLGSNFLSMMDNPEVLRGTLALYDWTDDEMNRRRLEAIVAVKHTLIRRFEKGFMLRGVDIEVTLNTDNFAGEGDVNLFGEMLHRFFALYADIHLFNQLTLVLQPTGKRLRWRENHSQHVPG